MDLTRIRKSLEVSRKPEESDRELRDRINALHRGSKVKKVQLFGQPSREFGDFGQLRRQKKAPYKEVLYIPVPAKELLKDGTEHVGGFVLRSINNAGNDQLTDHVRKVAVAMESGELASGDAEVLMDMIYAEIAIRVQSAEVIRAKRTQVKNS